MEINFNKLKGHQRPITNINLDNNNIISTGKDGKIVFWDNLKDSKTISCSGSIGTLGLYNENIYVGKADGMLCLFDLAGNKLGSFLAKGPIKAVSFNKEEMKYYLLAKKLSKTESILIILDQDLNLINELELEEEYNSLLQYSNKIICGSCSGIIKVLDLSLNSINEIKLHKSEITNIKVDFDKKIIVTSSYDNSLKILDISTLNIIGSFRHKASILTFSIHPTKNIIAIGGGHDKMTIATSSESGQFDIVFVDSLNYEKLFDLDSRHFGPVNCVTFHPDEKVLITGGEDGYIHNWVFESNWIEANIYKNKVKEYNEMNKLLSESRILLESLMGTGKNTKNQKRNLKKKIEKLEVNLPIKLAEINKMKC